jgi:glycosyltransferase involved in cell wall biosynthesis
MYRGKKISVYFPCRNEEAHLHETLSRVPKFVDEIIVVSNKSTDKTLERAKALGAIAIEDNRVLNGIGYGFAHITGTNQATGDIIATADGDLTYPIDRLDKVIDYLLDKNFDFISCNRYPLQEGTSISSMLRLGVFILNTEVRLLYGLKIKDILSGMWVFRKEVKNNLGLTMGDWNLSPQIKLNAARNKSIRFTEYSIAQHQRAGETKQSYWKTGFSHLLWILKNRFTKKR